jgi:hypothetical protein
MKNVLQQIGKWQKWQINHPNATFLEFYVVVPDFHFSHTINDLAERSVGPDRISLSKY